MKLDSEQKIMIGYPIIVSAGMTATVVPICMAVIRQNPAWLMLWIVAGALVGVMCAGFRYWAGEPET